MDQKPSHHYTEHDPIPKEIVQDDPSIAYLIEEEKKDPPVFIFALYNIIDTE